MAGGFEALLILLRRLTYPNRLCDLCQLFRRPELELSMIVHEVTKFFVSIGGGEGRGEGMMAAMFSVLLEFIISLNLRL